MSNFNPATADFAKGFDFDQGSMHVVGTAMDRGQPIPVVAYTSTWKGRKNFHIRTLWSPQDREEWNPGKGVSVPLESAGTLCSNIGKLMAPVPAAKGKK